MSNISNENMMRAQLEWEATVDSLDQIVLIVDSMGNIIRCNRTIESWQSKKVTEVKGSNFHSLLHPDCKDDDCYLLSGWNHCQEKLKEGSPYFFEHKDHILNRFLFIQFRPILLANKNKFSEETNISAVVVFQDVTKSKLVLNRIKQAASELSSIFQFIPDSYIRLDSCGIVRSYKSGNFSEDIFIGDESIGKNITDILPASLRDKFSSTIAKVIRTKELEVMEYTLHTAAGKQIFEARFIPIFKDQVNIINRNITENKRLVSVAETMNLMENLGYIFSGIRHEIGNPINTIKMTTSVLKNNLDRFSKDHVLEYLERVMHEVNRVEYLLKNLKNFNMFEEVNPTSIDLPSFMEQFLKLVSDDLEKKGIKILCELSPDAKTAYVDSRAFHQVLLNILTNSSDALKDADCPTISITIEKKPKKINFKIMDNGHGIAESHKKDIFKPFFTTKSQGTGLGLNIVQKIVNRMSGTIDIDSCPELGTTVTITIPEGKHVG